MGKLKVRTFIINSWRTSPSPSLQTEILQHEHHLVLCCYECLSSLFTYPQEIWFSFDNIKKKFKKNIHRLIWEPRLETINVLYSAWNVERFNLSFVSCITFMSCYEYTEHFRVCRCLSFKAITKYWEILGIAEKFS
jgi:hypothetical protein